jgi:transcriptional regulator with XRE-family HTH domain
MGETFLRGDGSRLAKVRPNAMDSALKTYLAAERGRATRLADSLGVSPGYVSDLAAGKKTARLQVYRRIADVTQIPLAELIGVTGFAEGTAQPILAPVSNRLGDIAGTIAPDARHPEYVRLTTDAPGFALLADDLVIYDAARLPELAPGTLAVARVATDNDDVVTVIVRLAQPWAMTSSGDIIGRIGDTVSIAGPVRGCLRGAGATRILKDF